MKNLQEPNSRHVSTRSSEVPGFMLVVLLGPKSSADPSLCSPKFEPFSRLQYHTTRWNSSHIRIFSLERNPS